MDLVGPLIYTLPFDVTHMRKWNRHKIKKNEDFQNAVTPITTTYSKTLTAKTLLYTSPAVTRNNWLCSVCFSVHGISYDSESQSGYEYSPEHNESLSLTEMHHVAVTCNTYL